MTKQVRVENADTGPAVVIIEVWDKGFGDEPDKMSHEVQLQHPAQLANDLYITSTRYLVVKEA